MEQLTLNDQRHAIWDDALIRRYDLSGPRYTSYPTAPQFHTNFGSTDLDEAVAVSNRRANPLSLYTHIPFCSRVCYYCACNKIITANRSVAQPYLERLEKEMAMMARKIDASRPVHQLHWGGGTPTYISDDEKRQLMATTRRYFNLLDDDRGEYAIEIHPGDTSVATIACLRELGFNRLSMGIQDFDAGVQRAVNRFNSVEEVSALVGEARQQGFHSISMDLIYGLPLQDRHSFSRTLDAVIDLSPDRLSIFNYAHMPHLFKTQKQIDETLLPEPEEKLVILHMAIERMLAAGYIYIGMDHFAKPADELAIAQREGKLQRNFQGYATHGDCDLLSFGVSAISAIGDTFSQNHKDIGHYNKAIDRGELPLARGLKLCDDDLIRAKVIEQLICHFCLDFKAIEHGFGIDFQRYFATELSELKGMAVDGLVSIDSQGLQVTGAGRMLIRRVCMVFDAWLQRADNTPKYSRII
ncbi:MAG: oxygen-independent coproporphyrinogen III oxidase [Porticoccaceae bacterium]|jgi:oxygen-independent coproporphyrinogen-3 oxidase